MSDGASPILDLRVAGTGSFLPGPPLDRDETRSLLEICQDGLSEIEHERMLASAGIVTRHFAFDPRAGVGRESNASMGAEAGRRALAAAGWQPDDVDLLVVTTVIPDQLMPPTSTLVQERLGIRDCMELEISANCTAPTKGLAFAASQIQIGAVARALVCNVQYISFTFFPPWADPRAIRADQGHLRWHLSDGAGAIAVESGSPGIDLRVVLSSTGTGSPSGMSMPLGATEPDLLRAHRTGLQHATQPRLRVLKEGIRRATVGVDRMLRRAELPGQRIDHFIPSVASVPIARVMQKNLTACGIRPEAWRTNFESVGYVGSVAVPIMLDDLAREGRLRAGDIVCTAAEESSKWMFAGSVFRWNPER